MPQGPVQTPIRILICIMLPQSPHCPQLGFPAASLVDLLLRLPASLTLRVLRGLPDDEVLVPHRSVTAPEGPVRRHAPSSRTPGLRTMCRTPGLGGTCRTLGGTCRTCRSGPGSTINCQVVAGKCGKMGLSATGLAAAKGMRRGSSNQRSLFSSSLRSCTSSRNAAAAGCMPSSSRWIARVKKFSTEPLDRGCKGTTASGIAVRTRPTSLWSSTRSGSWFIFVSLMYAFTKQ